MPTTVKTQIEKLRQQLRYHSYKYYVLDDPDIHDVESNRLCKQLRAKEDRQPKTNYSLYFKWQQ